MIRRAWSRARESWSSSFTKREIHQKLAYHQSFVPLVPRNAMTTVSSPPASRVQTLNIIPRSSSQLPGRPSSACSLQRPPASEPRNARIGAARSSASGFFSFGPQAGPSWYAYADIMAYGRSRFAAAGTLASCVRYWEVRNRGTFG